MSKKFENNKFENISHYKKISSIVEDRDKNLWFATEGAGLIKLETKTNKITNFSVNDGLISNFVTAITLDNKNRLWAAGDSGITIINIKTLTIDSISFGSPEDSIANPLGTPNSFRSAPT